MKAFFDTNILLYGLMPATGNSKDGMKHNVAARLIDEYVEADELVISTQVMSEFFVNATRKDKGSLTHSAAALVLDQMSLLDVISIDNELVLQAAVRMQRSQISYWDGLIVEAALRADATILYSEDMQHGMRFDSVEVQNPFVV